MISRTWFENPDHVVYAVISDLAQRIEDFSKAPTQEGENIKGLKRTTLKLMVPNLVFGEPIEMGENV